MILKSEPLRGCKKGTADGNPIDCPSKVTLRCPPPPPLRGEALDSYSSEVWICDHFEVFNLIDGRLLKIGDKWHAPNALGVGVTQHRS